MAEWKKVVVSGSDISQLNNDANYIAQNDTSVSLTGSFSGSFVGDGSELTGLPTAAIAVYNNAADNRIITSVDSSTVQGEANLTFNGSTLGVTGNITVTGTVDGVDVAQLETDFNTLEGKTLVSGSPQIDGASITNNTVNFGGVSVALNGSDTTPAFNLSDATAYPGDSSLTTLGTVTTGDVSAILPSGTVSGSAQVFSDVSGDITIASNGTATIQADSVALGTDTTGDYVASLGAGTGVTIGSNTGETSSPTIAVDYGSTANTAVQGNTNITLTQTAGEIDITGTAAQALGGAPSYTIGLADTISGNRTFSGDTITISNDLIVQGTASFQSTTNLEVADQFILLNSGSSTDNSPGGIVVQQNVQDVGVVLGYDAAAGSNAGRWGTKDGQNASATTFTADAYVSYVLDIDAGQSDISLYQKNGNIKVDSGDIFIYA